MARDFSERPFETGADGPRPSRAALYLLIVAIALLLGVAALAF